MKKNLHIIKVGGNIIDDDTRLDAFLSRFASLEGAKVLVHGGGKLATRLAADLKIPQQIVDGRRITDAETLRVAALQARNCAAIGLCGADADIIRAHKRQHATTDYGFVGDVDRVDGRRLAELADSGLAVILAPITHDGNGQLLNTNADTIAQETAKALSAYFDTTLIYCFEKAGVLLDAEDDSTCIPAIDPVTFETLKDEGKIFAGMIPKLTNAFQALGAGVGKVVIGKAEDWDRLMAGETGTTITLNLHPHGR